MMILVAFFSIYKNREVARCFHGYRNYAPHSDITRYQKLCTIPSSSRICIQIPLAYPALPNPLSRPLFPFCLSTITFTARNGMLCHRSSNVMSHVIGHVMSCPRSGHVMVCPRSCHRSCHVPGHVMSPVMSCPLSCHVMSPFMSCHVPGQVKYLTKLN